MAKASTKKRKVIIESTGEAHINATFNNIIISLTNKKGEVISWSSAGKMGFRGSKKNTPYAAQNSGVEVTEIIDVTPMPHNGCRPPKRRRV
jgi:small subunit ribosomal protein S11